MVGLSRSTTPAFSPATPRPMGLGRSTILLQPGGPSAGSHSPQPQTPAPPTVAAAARGGALPGLGGLRSASAASSWRSPSVIAAASPAAAHLGTAGGTIATTTAVRPRASLGFKPPSAAKGPPPPPGAALAGTAAPVAARMLYTEDAAVDDCDAAAGPARTKVNATTEADSVDAADAGAPMSFASPTNPFAAAAAKKTVFGASSSSVVNADGSENAGGDAAEGGEEKREPDVVTVVDRLPVSPHGRLYFQVTIAPPGGRGASDAAEAAAEKQSAVLDRTGIIVMAVSEGAAQLFDRSGRQYGNKPDPGYAMKDADITGARADVTLRIGAKPVELVTALPEVAFRSGEFFLRSDHEQRVREEKRKLAADLAEAEAKRAAKPRMSFGGASFQSAQLRRRPAEGASGFVVPVAGRVKTTSGGVQIGGDLAPLHDPDDADAVVLFRADFKRDLQGRRIVSVVVDPVLGKKLRPHQKIGVKFLFDCVTGERVPGYCGAILADEMGLGKTLQTIATVWTCLRQGKFGIPVSKKALIVAPSSLVRNWCNEFDKWLGPGVVKAFAIAESTAKGDRILSRFEAEGDVLVISYDQLRKYIDRIKTIRGLDLVFCDEGHRLKNAEIKTTRAVDMLPTRRRVILSGTPIQNDLEEFHAMVGFVNPGILGSIDLFRRVFQEPIMLGREPGMDDYTRDLGADRAHYLANLTQKFILRRTQSINEKYLPAKVDMTVFCRLGAEQAGVYQRVFALSDKFSSSPLVLITGLKKLCNHVDLLHDAISANTSQLKLPSSVLPKGYAPGSLQGTFGSKMEFLSLMLDELPKYQDKLVVVSNYTQTLDVIAALCNKKNVAFFQLDGATPIKKRQELVDRFNVPTQREIVFLLSSKAGGVGLNLIGANRLILFDPDWNPANDAQAMGRVWRDGQKKRVFLYRLLSTGTIEEKVYQRQVSKQGLSANVVDMQEDSKQHFSTDELKALFTYRPDTVCDTHDLLNCKCQAPKHKAEGDGTIKGFRRVAPREEGAGGPRMDELKSWQHVADAQSFALDPVVQTISGKRPGLVSFLFANERDAQRLSGPQVTTERTLAGIEGDITCASQADAADGGDENDAEVVVSPVKRPRPRTAAAAATSDSGDGSDDEDDAAPRSRRAAAPTRKVAAKKAPAAKAAAGKRRGRDDSSSASSAASSSSSSSSSSEGDSEDDAAVTKKKTPTAKRASPTAKKAAPKSAKKPAPKKKAQRDPRKKAAGSDDDLVIVDDSDADDAGALSSSSEALSSNSGSSSSSSDSSSSSSSASDSD